eukprot:gene11105-13588_t
MVVFKNAKISTKTTTTTTTNNNEKDTTNDQITTSPSSTYEKIKDSNYFSSSSSSSSTDNNKEIKYLQKPSKVKYDVLNSTAKAGQSTSLKTIEDFEGPDYELVNMVSEGMKYRCYIPKPSFTVFEGYTALPTAEDMAKDIQPLSELCLRKTIGWWTYEFCHKNHVKQIHFEKGVLKSEYVLGKVPLKNRVGEIRGIDEDFIKKYKSRQLLELPDGVTPYYSETFTDGTPCDLFNVNRQTEIRYYCLEHPSFSGYSDYIQEILEPSSCSYILKVHTQNMCKHPLFKPKKDTVMNIECFQQKSDTSTIKKQF